MAFLVKGTTIVGANIDIGKEITAADVVYDNTESSLEATNVQDAIDSLASSEASAATKVSGAIEGHFASLTEDGNISDSGKKASDFAGAGDLVNLSDEVSVFSEQISNVSKEAFDIKMLGWSVPKECPVQNYMDNNRVFHQRVGRVDLGSLSWTNDTVTGGIHAKFARLSDCKIVGNSTKPNMYCVGYMVSTVSNVDYGRVDDSISGADSNGRIWIYSSKYNDYTAEQFKAAMQGVYLYYELAEEIVTPMDGNEFSANLGDAWNSSTTYKVGDYCIYSNALYKCKISHSNVIPTNTSYWTKVTIGGELSKKYIINDYGNADGTASLAYTGRKITIPANSIYSLRFALSYNASNTREIAVTTVESNIDNWNTVARTDMGGSISLSGYTPNEITFYVWGRWLSAGTNRVSILGYYENLN